MERFAAGKIAIKRAAIGIDALAAEGLEMRATWIIKS